MYIRADEVERITIDRFTSTSGRYLFLLAETTVMGLLCSDLVAMNPENYKVVKIVRLAVDNRILASLKWEYIKSVFTAPAGEEEPVDEFIRLPTAAEVFARMEEILAMKMDPIGARIFVTDITPIDEISARAAKAGIEVLIDEKNKPRPTMGIVVAVGEDPFTKELYKIGDIVMFNKHAGSPFSEDGQQFRSLEIHEVMGRRKSEHGIEDITGEKQ